MKACKRMMWCFGALLLGVTLFCSLGSAQEPVFQGLDGDSDPSTGTNAAGLIEDWNTLYAGGGTAQVHQFLANQGYAFATGGSKDYNLIGSWRYTVGTAPDKDAITNAYAAAYNEGGHLVIYFGADRYDTSGDANIGFWFFKQNVYTEGGRFVGEHSIGDLFVVSQFTGGGSNATVRVYRWVGSGGDQQKGTLLEVPQAEATAQAITNGSPFDPAWAYTSKDGSANIPVAGFFEGRIDITEAFGGGGSCFASFMAETRSSSTMSAVLKDFVVGSFPLCAVKVSKTCEVIGPNATGDAFLYKYKLKVTNEGYGPLYDIVATDSLPAGSTPDGDYTFSVGELSAGSDETSEYLYFSSIHNGVENNASVVAATVDDGTPDLSANALPATCPATTINKDLTVTKTCSTLLDTVGGHAVVKVNFAIGICNGSSVKLTNIQVTDSKAGFLTTVSELGPATTAGDTCTALPITGSYSYYPASAPTPTPPTGHRYVFTDDVSVTADTPLTDSEGNVVKWTETGSASCGVCAPCDECSDVPGCT